MKFSIIIPTANRPDLLTKCIEALQQQTEMESEDVEIIISDDSMSEEINKEVKIKFPFAHWINGPRRGPAANRNHAANDAKGNWIIFLDDDCIPVSNWFSSYHEALMQHDEISVFEGKTLALGNRIRFNETAPLNVEGGNLWSCNFMIKKSLYQEFQGFDESFPYPAMEDVDFCMRIKSKEKIFFVPNAIVFHPWRVIKPFSMFKKHLKSHIILSRKHQLHGNIKYRWSRVKIFLGHTISDFILLSNLSFRGFIGYFENVLLNFLLIFA